MFDNVLYIIGNGFDLHHGVMSGYGAFAVWLKGHNRNLYRKLLAVCDTGALWRDFETALAYVDRDYFLSWGDVWLPRNWTEDDSCAELFFAEDMVRNEADALWSEIVKWFRKWVCTIRWRPECDRRRVRIDTEARFITFNYTPFLETQYGIPRENILYIHGKSSDVKHPPVIGHDGRDTFSRWYRRGNPRLKKYYRGSRSFLPEVEMMRSSVEEYFSLSKKPVGEILEQHRTFIGDLYDVEYIYVLGHSLGSVDLPYFRTIGAVNAAPERLRWNVSYYSDKERAAMEEIMRTRVMHEDAALQMFRLDEIRC